GGLGFLLARALIAEWHGAADAAAEARSLARLFLRVVIPLLAAAAFVEAFITPAILSMIT
ncbi:MAG TPA: stage II sporulation protein M, partial [Methanoculleus sp.]|nr:stage II sporulation protein M [Methanoculleus sp.]